MTDEQIKKLILDYVGDKIPNAYDHEGCFDLDTYEDRPGYTLAGVEDRFLSIDIEYSKESIDRIVRLIGELGYDVFVSWTLGG